MAGRLDAEVPNEAPPMPKKLTPQDLEKYGRILARMRDEITGDMEHLESDALDTGGFKASVDNPADAGSDSFAQEFNLELLARDEETLSEIVDAIDRIASGTFGKCEACDDNILKTRLNAVPYARNCIDCQRAAEESQS